jgi:8-hydroxy-5-deazaflavin:NADPH oxidoreductase
MATVTIIGTGNIGSAVAAIAAKGGNDVQVLDTTTPDTVITGDVVVLAASSSPARSSSTPPTR